MRWPERGHGVWGTEELGPCSPQRVVDFVSLDSELVQVVLSCDGLESHLVLLKETAQAFVDSTIVTLNNQS